MIPKIALEKLSLSKIICGTNQFVGITHRNNPFDIILHKIRFRDPKTIANFFIYLINTHGINCCLSSPRENLAKAITLAENETGTKFHWLCSPSRRLTVKGVAPNLFQQIDWCSDHNVSVCLTHRNYTDEALDKMNFTIGGQSADLPPYPEVSAYIRDKGMIPGLSTHMIESIEAVEKQHYDAPIIIQPLNKIGFESNCPPDTLIQKIQSTKLHIINIKPMAAGRISPEEGIPYCLNAIKPNDFLAVGFGKFQYCVSDLQLIEKILK